MSKLIVNVETGKTTERDLNKAELDQQKIDEALENERALAKAEKEATKAALLTRLGITADEAKLLIG